jgi:hypothetical protein
MMTGVQEGIKAKVLPLSPRMVLFGGLQLAENNVATSTYESQHAADSLFELLDTTTFARLCCDVRVD